MTKITLRTNLKILSTAISLTLFLCSCQSATTTKDVVATYHGGKVTIKNANDELAKLVSKNEKLKGLTFEKLTPEQKEALVKEVVLKEMIYREAKKRGLDKDRDYQVVLKNFESELLQQKLLLVLAKDATDEKNLKKSYDEMVGKLQGKKDLRISYVALKTKADAEVTHKIVTKSPSYFASQARKKSVDKETAKKGGDLGFVMEDMLPADVVAQVKTLQKSQISQPFFTGGKWVIIKLDDERPAEILPYEKMKNLLTQNLARKAVEDFALQSLEKAKVSVLKQ
ncbi:MAG: hypothetical protein FJX34_05540 [Alphaproteobacteria bacterium]|nr:hypothetical protein [Alphaproteobacteria bacterium]